MANGRPTRLLFDIYSNGANITSVWRQLFRDLYTFIFSIQFIVVMSEHRSIRRTKTRSVSCQIHVRYSQAFLHYNKPPTALL